ncbi:MAG: type II toxin-antitoxin system HicA family toxin [Leptolyngbyaceae cyanobacterium CAN_BIN12]|nr:type II toxin-antitoxin system HicA family toxin [Leptolyngbyaceae cyanobacterium CAN_BIN12]
MSRIKKLVLFLLSNPAEADFSDIKRVLEAFEFPEVCSSGSHVIFRHADGRMQCVPKKKGRKVKQIYIKQVVEILELEEWLYEQEED